MPLLKLALVLFSFQTIVFFCISGFNDDLSLSTTVTNFWSNLIHGSINKAYHLEVPPDFKQDIWIYLFLSVFRCLCNFTTASNKLRTRTDNIQLLQFLLGSTLSCYLFFLDLWLSTSRGFENGFVVLPILSFISMEIDFSILARWLGFGAAYIFQIICAIGSVSIFYAHHGCYWLFIPYILIPAFDIFKTIFQSTWTKCDPSMYFEHLLPSFLIIAYVKPLSGTYVLLNPPETKVVDTCGIFLVLGLLLMAAKSIIFKFYAYNQRIKNRFVIQRPCNDEKCSICLENLVKRVYGKTSVLSSANYCCASLSQIISYLLELVVKKNKNQNMIVLKTPCNHLFHEKCLEKWISNRPECPYCRKELINFL